MPRRVLFAIGATVAGGALGILDVVGAPAWLLVLLTFPVLLLLSVIGHRYVRRLPTRRALAISSATAVAGSGMIGFMLIGFSERYGWIQTAIEVAAGLYLLFDVSTWPMRRAEAGQPLFQVPKPWWLVPGAAFIAVTAIVNYFAWDFSSDAGFLGGLFAVIIIIGTLELFLEVLIGTQFRERGVLSFSGLITWSQIRAYDFEDSHSQVRSLAAWSSWLHLYLRRRPPLMRLLMNGNLLEKRLSIPLRSDEERTQIEAILMNRAHLDSAEVLAPAT